jgi:hypothetical protein
MSQQTLKELFKPTFRKYCYKRKISNEKGKLHINWHKTRDLNLDDDIGEYICSALNEKAERNFGDPMRWITDDIDYKCPACNTNFFFNGHTPDVWGCRYCPHCGQRLDVPEE